jgi:hypothetical protein
MTFSDELRRTPTTPTQTTAQGIVPPLIRTTAHLTHVLSDILNQRQWTPDDMLAEMLQIRTHINALQINANTVSDQCNGILAALAALVHTYTTEFPSWDTSTNEPREALVNTQAVLDRISAVSTVLDRELAGIYSDPGRDI